MARHTLNLAVNSSCDGLPTKTTLHSKFNTTVQQDFIAFALALAQCQQWPSVLSKMPSKSLTRESNLCCCCLSSHSAFTVNLLSR